MVTNLLAFAEFERAMILERTQGGKAIAKQKKQDTRKVAKPKCSTKPCSKAKQSHKRAQDWVLAEVRGINKRRKEDEDIIL